MMENPFIESVKTKSNEELLKMVYEFETWSPEMLDAVDAELAKRNLLPADVAIRKQKAIKIAEAKLEEARQASLFGQILGWLTIFGLLGIIIGYNYAFSKEHSKFTDKVYFKYNESSRKNGIAIFYTSVVIVILALLVFAFNPR